MIIVSIQSARTSAAFGGRRPYRFAAYKEIEKRRQDGTR